jgi:hypothetical protein
MTTAMKESPLLDVVDLIQSEKGISMAKFTFFPSLARVLLVPAALTMACATTTKPPGGDRVVTIGKPGEYQPRQPETATVLAIDSKGRRVVAGTFAGELKVGDRTITAADGVDAFVAVLDKAGRLAWLKHLSGPSHQTATGVTVDRQDNVIVAGTIQGGITKDAPVQFRSQPGRDHGVYVTKFSPEGNVLWSRLAARLAMETNASVALGQDGKIALGGTFIRFVEVGGKGFTDAGQSMFLTSLEPADGSVTDPTMALLSFGGINWKLCPHHPFVTGAGISPYCTTNTAWAHCASMVCNEIDVDRGIHYGYCCGGSTYGSEVWDQDCVTVAQRLCPTLAPP